MEVILLERVGQARPDGRRRARQRRICPQLSAAEGQGAARHQGKPLPLRNHEDGARGAQSRAARRGREGRQEARRPELHGAAPGGRRRPALRLGLAARHRHAGDREGLQDRPQSDHAQHADQDHRHAQSADRAASGGRGHGHGCGRPQCRRGRPAWPAARTSPSPAPRSRRPRPRRSRMPRASSSRKRPRRSAPPTRPKSPPRTTK